jgi:hypothetical protein
MKNVFKALMAMVIAAGIGFGAVRALIRPAFGTTVKSASVVIEVQVVDMKGRPVKGADVSVLVPRSFSLGRTDSKGTLRGKMRVASSKTYTLEVVGRGQRSKRAFTVDAGLSKPKRFKVVLGSSPSALRAATIPAARPRPQPTGAVPRVVPVRIFHGPGVDKAAMLRFSARLKVLMSTRERSGAFSARGVKSLQVRHVGNEARFVELIPVDARGRALGGYLLQLQGTSDTVVTHALSNMWSRALPRGGGTNRRLLSVETDRPSEARAYLNGIPLARRVERGRAVFDLGGHPASRSVKAILSLTSDDGPLIRTRVTVASLGRDIRWSLPETALTRR